MTHPNIEEPVCMICGSPVDADDDVCTECLGDEVLMRRHRQRVSIHMDGKRLSKDKRPKGHRQLDQKRELVIPKEVVEDRPRRPMSETKNLSKNQSQRR